MINDRASWIYEYIRKGNQTPVFITQNFDGYAVRIACNRAARRFLKSNKIITLAKSKSCKIEHDADYSCIF